MKDIIIAPVITEKAAALAANGKTYVFKVAKSANKIEIKTEIEKLFNVKVESVKTLNTKAKEKELDVTLEKQKLIRRLSLL